MIKNRIGLLLIVMAMSYKLLSQTPTSWDASWIACPQTDLSQYGVFHFQKTIALKEKPTHFSVRITADNKYRLFVNGQYVAMGPALGDTDNWFYDTVDIAPYLQKGENTLATMVWNFGDEKGWNQISMKTGFLLQGDTPAESVVNTNSSWKVLKNEAYSPKRINPNEIADFIVIGCGDSIYAEKFPWGWTQDKNLKWLSAKELERGNPKGYGSGCTWSLMPRMIPMLGEKEVRFSLVRRSSNPIDNRFLKGEQTCVVPQNTTFSVLIDQTNLINAYPVLTFSKGKGAVITLTYCEGLIDKNGQKGNRNEIENKSAHGIKDVIVADGGIKRIFQPLDYRTYRYLQIDVTTDAEALVLDDLHQIAIGYPFEERAKFASDDSTLTKIWDVGWRTARLCATETYMDCPYYERMQYVGDTRIQALISLYMTGDDRLMKQAIVQLGSSRFGDGLTLSRYPTNSRQVIPPFSLFWVDMIYDYLMHCPDTDFVKNYLGGIYGVLDWYQNKLDATSGMLGAVPYWNFVDWTAQWPWDTKLSIGGVPRGGVSGGSSILTLQYVYALQKAAVVFEVMGKKAQAAEYQLEASEIAKSVYRNCWDVKKQLLSDAPEKKVFSQHANIFGILTSAIPDEQQKKVMNTVLSDPSLIQCSLYFRFYLAQALNIAGMGDNYVFSLQPWVNALAMGLSTFPETPEPTRSDCHAWSASPNYDLLATVCGIKPLEPAFRKVHIEPNLGTLSFVEAQMPHPLGEIKVKLNKQGENGVKAEIYLPEDITGDFVWRNAKYNLTGGVNLIDMR